MNSPEYNKSSSSKFVFSSYSDRFIKESLCFCFVKTGILFSGGKDSCLAFYKAQKLHEVSCLISLVSENEESYMFHVPNIELVRVQANSIGLPLVLKNTKGQKEEELKDLRDALVNAKEEYGIEGIVTGAIKSVYQASRIQRICFGLDMWCFNPLWLRNQVELLKEIVEEGFRVIISGVFAYPLDRSYLGREIDGTMIETLAEFEKKFGLNPSGEGGEIETTVLDAPFFKRRLEVIDYDITHKNYSGSFKIKNVRSTSK